MLVCKVCYKYTLYTSKYRLLLFLKGYYIYYCLSLCVLFIRERMRESEIQILKKSLNVIIDFYERVEMVNSSTEFLEIHNRNIKMLSDLGLERQSIFIKKCVDDYPKLRAPEVELFISRQRKERSFLWFVGGRRVGFIYDLIKTRGVLLSQVKKKITKIKELNLKMYKVVENPIFEELYLKTMDSNG